MHLLSIRTLLEGWQKKCPQDSTQERRREVICMLTSSHLLFPLVKFPGVLAPLIWLVTGDVIQTLQCSNLDLQI